MKRYPAYKDSGIEWIGQVPQDWKVNRLKTFCTFTYGDSLANENRVEGGVPVYGSNGIVGYHNKAITHKPCIIIGRKGSYGKVNFSQTECFPIDTTYFIDDRSARCDLEWLQYVLPLLELDKFSKDTGVPGLNREDAHDKRVPVPESNVQKAIVTYLDRKTAQIDDLIAKKERMIELLKEERTTIINQAVTQGLDPKVEMKDSGIEWLGKIPKHWQMKRLKYLVSLVNQPIEEANGLELRIDLENLESWTGKTIELESQDQNNEGMKSFASGDVLFNKLRPYLAKVYRAKNCGVCGGELLVLRPTTLIVADFLFYRVLSSAFINVVDGSTYGSKMPRASWDFIANLIVPFPGKPEQIKIAEYLHQSLQRMDIILQKLGSEIDYLREYRIALISEVVTGKICVYG